MAVDDGNLDIEDFEFEDLISNDLEKQYCGLLEVPLCSIQEYMEWFPTSDDFLSLNDGGLTPDQNQSGCFLSPKGQDGGAKGNQQTTEQNFKNQNRHEMKKDDGLEYLLHAGLVGFTRKKCRTKNYQRPKCRVTWERKRCSHCETEETPQWRAGPAGPKTLCNACGVRFKSGRLVPEYRPATSPTFDGSRHSNYHRMILKKLRSST